MTKWRMRIACWLPKATNTYSQYVILIAFPRQQWLHERKVPVLLNAKPVGLRSNQQVNQPTGSVRSLVDDLELCQPLR